MAPHSSVEFPPFRLDLASHELWRGGERLTLRPKPFAVLSYLATHAQRLVPRAELVQAVWPDTHVGEGLLRGYVRDVRTVLGDDPAAPRFIETVARLGYRFVALVRRSDRPVFDDGGNGASHDADSRPSNAVGRAAELLELEHRLTAALAGTRQVVFVTGEPGIGKTTLLDSFVARAVASRELWTARGQCVEHFGAGEAYLPLLEALGHLCRMPRCEQVVATLARHAPTWLVQMPALIADAELETVQRRVQGATRERMLREFAEAVEVLTALQPLLLVLEDLQWSDDSTLDSLSSLAQRRGKARLLVLCTYRPAAVIPGGHPLAAIKQELQLHGQCDELAMPPLDVAGVAQYLACRFPRQRFPGELAGAIHRATEGNPLFAVNLVDDLVARGVLAEHDELWQLDAQLADVGRGVPDTLREMVERQLERLEPETRRVLEAASVAGGEFSTATVAAALEETEERVDEWCEGLAARGPFLRECGFDALANGTVAGRYAFLHALYQQALYERLALARRVRLHRRIGEWEESAYGVRVHEHAAQLAVHFERGHEQRRAIHHLEAAAQNAMRKHAYREATALLERALGLLDALPDAAERERKELALRMALGTPLLMTRGYAAPEVEQVYARAHELSRHMQDSLELVFALAGLFRFFFVRAKLQAARELGDQVLRLAESRDPSLLAVAHSMVALPALSAGDFATARAHLEQGVALYDFERHRSLALQYGDDPALTSLAFLSILLWFLGEPDRALERSREARALAERLGVPYSRAFAWSFATWIHVRRGEAAAAQACSETLIALATEQEFPFFVAEGTIFRGWALAEQGEGASGIEEMRRGLAAHRAAGVEMGRPSHLALLAEAYGRAGRTDEGLVLLDEALTTAAATEERSCEADLLRLKGELLLQTAKRTARKAAIEADAEAALRQALAIARRQGARSFELRAAMALARLRRTPRDRAAARRLLAGVYGRFTEGFDTADLRTARAVLDARS